MNVIIYLCFCLYVCMHSILYLRVFFGHLFFFIFSSQRRDMLTLEAFIFTQSITIAFDRKEKNDSFSFVFIHIYLHLTWWISTKKVRKNRKRRRRRGRRQWWDEWHSIVFLSFHNDSRPRSSMFSHFIREKARKKKVDTFSAWSR